MKTVDRVMSRISRRNIPTWGIQEEFYVVTFPESASTLIDICFATDFAGLMLQSRGGLDLEEIYGIYGNEADAMTDAKKLLRDQQG